MDTFATYKADLVSSIRQTLDLLVPVVGSEDYDDAARALGQRLEWIVRGDLDHQIQLVVDQFPNVYRSNRNV
jgi:hypothetical protein